MLIDVEASPAWEWWTMS